MDKALRQGARAHGFDTDHWTLARITTVIGQTTGHRCHPGHTWKLLRRMGWRLQRPPPPRGDRVLGREWRLAATGHPSHLGAPRGHPVIGHRFKWQRCSMAAAICYGSLGGGAAVAFHHQADAYDTDGLIGALDELRGFLGGQKATLVRDGLPAHRSRAMRAWLARQQSWLVVERLPGDVPDLNPVGACGMLV